MPVKLLHFKWGLGRVLRLYIFINATQRTKAVGVERPTTNKDEGWRPVCGHLLLLPDLLHVQSPRLQEPPLWGPLRPVAQSEGAP